MLCGLLRLGHLHILLPVCPQPRGNLSSTVRFGARQGAAPRQLCLHISQHRHVAVSCQAPCQLLLCAAHHVARSQSTLQGVRQGRQAYVSVARAQTHIRSVQVWLAAHACLQCAHQGEVPACCCHDLWSRHWALAQCQHWLRSYLLLAMLLLLLAMPPSLCLLLSWSWCCCRCCYQLFEGQLRLLGSGRGGSSSRCTPAPAPAAPALLCTTPASAS
mmetsp:Transcript_13502/g.36547  ORF Transcript_13502/g.36547 Transcript_13502/m.36547 type:complete len:216 (-) Transcript_13502:778-1425(-)